MHTLTGLERISQIGRETSEVPEASRWRRARGNARCTGSPAAALQIVTKGKPGRTSGEYSDGRNRLQTMGGAPALHCIESGLIYVNAPYRESAR